MFARLSFFHEGQFITAVSTRITLLEEMELITTEGTKDR